MRNKILDTLIALNISTEASFEPYHPRTRDNPDIAVLKCSKSGVIALEQQLEDEEMFYKENEHYVSPEQTITKDGPVKTVKLNDGQRRFDAYKDLIEGRDLLDFGCGRGELLYLAKDMANRSIGVELGEINRKGLNDMGILCVEKIQELDPSEPFDVITLNHVYEHLSEPLSILEDVKPYLKDDGVLIIEVPHARDMLLSMFDLRAFKDFTFREEHLILHTRESLETFVQESGFVTEKVVGCQRYPVSNQMHWLKDGEPGGNFIYEELNDQAFHDAYEKLLSDIDRTDTIIGYFKKAS